MIIHSEAFQSNFFHLKSLAFKEQDRWLVFVFSKRGRFPHKDSEICVADLHSAATFTAVDDKHHLLIQPDSSPTS